MLSNALIQFSLDGQGCVPSLLLVEVMKIMAASFKRSNACTAALSALTLHQVTTAPCLCWRLLDSHGQVWVSLLWGHCSFLLGPGAHKIFFVPSKSLFPQSCVLSGGSLVVLMATFTKRVYTVPGLLHPDPLPLLQVTEDPYLCRRCSGSNLIVNSKVKHKDII